VGVRPEARGEEGSTVVEMRRRRRAIWVAPVEGRERCGHGGVVVRISGGYPSWPPAVSSSPHAARVREGIGHGHQASLSSDRSLGSIRAISFRPNPSCPKRKPVTYRKQKPVGLHIRPTSAARSGGSLTRSGGQQFLFRGPRANITIVLKLTIPFTFTNS
jgi:hypothetical protein